MKTSPRKAWYEPYHRLLLTLIEISAHLVIVLVVLGSIRLLEVVVHWLWQDDQLFFDRLTLRYIFDGADLLILVGFLMWGVYSILATYIRKP